MPLEQVKLQCPEHQISGDLLVRYEPVAPKEPVNRRQGFEEMKM
jgi:hypothetical protein